MSTVCIKFSSRECVFMLWLYHFPKSIFGFSFGTTLEDAWALTDDPTSTYAGFHQRIESPACFEDVMKGSRSRGHFSVLCAIEGTVCRFNLGFEPNSENQVVMTTAEIESLPASFGESDYDFGYFVTFLDRMAASLDCKVTNGLSDLLYMKQVLGEVDIHSWVERNDGRYGDFLVRFTTDRTSVIEVDKFPKTHKYC